MDTSALATLDWSLLQAFVAVAQEGSLSGASRRMGTSQPTLGRQIKALEDALEVTIFLRRAKGLELTEAGSELLEHARDMQQAAQKVALSAAGRSDRVAGTVRLSASVSVSMTILPPIIARMRTQEPDIQIELAPSDATDNLLFREADIALRMYRPDQLDVVTRYLGDLELGLFGRRDYVETLPELTTIEALLDCNLVGYDREERIIRGLRELGRNVDRTTFGVRCDDQNVYFALVRAGCGLGFAPKHDAAKDPSLVQVAPHLPIPTLQVWLTAHESLRNTPRLRRVWDILVEDLTALLKQPPT